MVSTRLSAILHKEPKPAGEVTPNLPAELGKIISRCLRKDSERRAHSMADVRLALEELREDTESGKLSSTAASAVPAAARPPARPVLWFAAIVLGATALLALAASIDLDSNHTEPLLPGIPIGLSPGPSFWIPGYDISPDGRRLVFSSPDREGKPRLWLSPLDRRSPPLQVPNVEGEQPLFGPSGEIFFRKVEGTSAFLYSVREDGGGLRRAAESQVLGLFQAYPDHKWLLIGMAAEGETVFPTRGGVPLSTHLHPPEWVSWTGDGKHLFVSGESESTSRAYVLPLSPGQVLPESIARAKSFPSKEELAKLPGVRILPVGDVEPGPTADIYAFTREAVQRNLYQIPVP